MRIMLVVNDVGIIFERSITKVINIIKRISLAHWSSLTTNYSQY